jgi:hypothetical protein
MLVNHAQIGWYLDLTLTYCRLAYGGSVRPLEAACPLRRDGKLHYCR